MWVFMKKRVQEALRSILRSGKDPFLILALLSGVVLIIIRICGERTGSRIVGDVNSPFSKYYIIGVIKRLVELRG